MDKKKKGLSLDAVVALILISVILVLTFEGIAVQHLPKGAMGFPGFVFSVILIVGILELLRIRKTQREGHETHENVFVNCGNFMVACGLIIGYLVLMWLVGFILSTIAFTIVFVVKFRYKHVLIFGIAAILAAVGLYYIFKNVMYIHLPDGLLFELIS